MMLARALSTAAAVVYLLAGATASAQSAAMPAEFPPASYEGAQYVDSKGCVFVRAGFDGAVAWVPRMSRSRTQVCGVAPTFATAPEPEAPVIADAPAAATTTTTVVKKQSASTSRTVVRTERKPATVAVKTTPPRPVTIRRTATPRPAATPAGATTTRIVLRDGKKYRVVTRTRAPGEVRTADATQIRPPRGYKRVWTDGRLNPLRGERTQAGREQMALLWTQDVPHRLIDVRTGRDVTAQRAEMVYPYTSLAEQQRDLGPTTTTTASSKAVAAPKSAPQTRRVVKKITRNARTGEVVSVSTVSTKGAPRQPVTAPAAQAAGARFVQVGTFGQAANARRSAARLQAAGLPVRTRALTRNGQPLTIVLAGPFSGDALAAGLRKARALGFPDAFAR